MPTKPHLAPYNHSEVNALEKEIEALLKEFDSDYKDYSAHVGRLDRLTGVVSDTDRNAAIDKAMSAEKKLNAAKDGLAKLEGMSKNRFAGKMIKPSLAQAREKAEQLGDTLTAYTVDALVASHNELRELWADQKTVDRLLFKFTHVIGSNMLRADRAVSRAAVNAVARMTNVMIDIDPRITEQGAKRLHEECGKADSFADFSTIARAWQNEHKIGTWLKDIDLMRLAPFAAIVVGDYPAAGSAITKLLASPFTRLHALITLAMFYVLGPRDPSAIGALVVTAVDAWLPKYVGIAPSVQYDAPKATFTVAGGDLKVDVEALIRNGPFTTAASKLRVVSALVYFSTGTGGSGVEPLSTTATTYTAPFAIETAASGDANNKFSASLYAIGRAAGVPRLVEVRLASPTDHREVCTLVFAP